MSKHRFHFVIDKGLLSKIDYFVKSKSLNSRGNAINLILDSLDRYVRKEISKGCPNNICDTNDEPVNIGIFVNIDIKHFNKLRFLRYVFKTFSFATVLRRLIRIFFDGVQNNYMGIKKNEKYWISTHMNESSIYNITISTDFFLKKLKVPPDN